MKKKLALITVVYNNYQILDDFFQSLEKQNNKNFHLFIADLSTKQQKIKETSFPITVIFGKNKGYGYGINLGLKKAIELGLDQFCVLNNDIFFEKDFIDNCFLSLKNHPGSLIGGKIYYAPGYEYHKQKYQKKDLGRVVWYAGGSVDWQSVITPHIGVDQVDNGQFDKEKKIDFVTGCLMVLDKKVIDKVGFFDESYFLYYEDADLSLRAKRNNVPLIYDPTIVIWHKNAQSTEGAGSSIHQKFQKKNRLKFGLKYAPIKTKLHLIKNFLLGR